MNKLLELLNEFAHTYADHYDDTGEEIECKFLYHTDQCFTYEEEWKYDTLVDDVVISKRFGFIKWLDYHDKIDYKKLDKIKSWQTLDECSINNEIYEDLLMLLAISDSPVIDLISYLK